MGHWSEFYRDEHDGNRYGDGHSGWDLKRHPVGTAIPASCAGIVVASGWDDNYGWFVVWQCDHNEYLSRSHMKKRGLKKGATVLRGKSVGQVGDTGDYSKGPHCHAGQSDQPTPARGNRVDPRPHIAAQFSRPATSVATSIASATEAVLLTSSGDDEVKFLSHKTETAWYLVGETSVQRTRDRLVALEWKEIYGTSTLAASSTIKEHVRVAETNRATAAAVFASAVRSALEGRRVTVEVDYDLITANTDELIEGLPDDIAETVADEIDYRARNQPVE